MSDLISRVAVIEVLKQTGIIQDNDRGHLVVDEINRIPTAYDKEKVVEELEEEKEVVKEYEKYHCSVRFDKAIKIVRKGGVE